MIAQKPCIHALSSKYVPRQAVNFLRTLENYHKQVKLESRRKITENVGTFFVTLYKSRKMSENNGY